MARDVVIVVIFVKNTDNVPKASDVVIAVIMSRMLTLFPRPVM